MIRKERAGYRHKLGTKVDGSSVDTNHLFQFKFPKFQLLALGNKDDYPKMCLHLHSNGGPDVMDVADRIATLVKMIPKKALVSISTPWLCLIQLAKAGHFGKLTGPK